MNGPNPGSDEAVAQGCTCAVMDNGHGEGCGQFDKDGEPLFWINSGCPLHGKEDAKAIMDEIVLPWPDRALHPNARVHWAKRSKAAKAARQSGYVYALHAGAYVAEVPDGYLQVWIDGYPPDRRRRDADGLLSSLKPWLDGIADALHVDDRRFVPHPWVKDEVRKPGEVRIRIYGTPT